MTTQVLHFVELSRDDRRRISALRDLGRAGKLELRVKASEDGRRAVPLPPDAAALVESLLDHLVRGARVAVLAEDRELSPNEAATILGLSRPLVVHRMETGDLPFRYVGAHRRTRLRDVLALKARLDAQQTAVDALAGETETLMRDHGL